MLQSSWGLGFGTQCHFCCSLVESTQASPNSSHSEINSVSCQEKLQAICEYNLFTIITLLTEIEVSWPSVLCIFYNVLPLVWGHLMYTKVLKSAPPGSALEILLSPLHTELQDSSVSPEFLLLFTVSFSMSISKFFPFYWKGCGLSCFPWKGMLKPWLSAPQHVALFGNRVFTEVIKLKGCLCVP